MKSASIVLTLILSSVLLSTSCTKESVGGAPVGTSDEEDQETGMVWGINDLAEEIVSGIRLILIYDAPSGSFKGFIENTTIDIAPLSVSIILKLANIAPNAIIVSGFDMVTKKLVRKSLK